MVLCVTGYLIGSPPTSVIGEASANFQFGYIRLIHFAAGQFLALALLYRIFWAFGQPHLSPVVPARYGAAMVGRGGTR